jgi:hypothetical protein
MIKVGQARLTESGSREGIDRARDRATRNHLLQIYKRQIPVIEQALDTAALMLGTDKSRGYCLEMICADFLAGGEPGQRNPEILLSSMTRFLEFLPGKQRQQFLSHLAQKA